MLHFGLGLLVFATSVVILITIGIVLGLFAKELHEELYRTAVKDWHAIAWTVIMTAIPAIALILLFRFIMGLV